MKTPETAANLAIKALADSIFEELDGMLRDSIQAKSAAEVGDLNLTIGCLLPIKHRLETLQAQVDAALLLHKNARR